jgi:hypothetical protein
VRAISVTVAEVEFVGLRTPLHPLAAFSWGRAGERNVGLVRVRRSDGVTGWGETSVTFPLWSLEERAETVARGVAPAAAAEEIVAEGARAVADGYRAVRLRVGFSDEADLALAVPAVTELGAGRVLLDANMARDRDRALDMADRLAGIGAGWLEEPVARDDVAGLAAVRRRCGLRVAAGENCTPRPSCTTCWRRTPLTPDAGPPRAVRQPAPGAGGGPGRTGARRRVQPPPLRLRPGVRCGAHGVRRRRAVGTPAARRQPLADPPRAPRRAPRRPGRAGAPADTPGLAPAPAPRVIDRSRVL